MTKADAIETAKRWTRKYGREYFVIWSVEDQDEPGQHYHPTDEDTAQTFYMGCGDPVAGPFEVPAGCTPAARRR
jgi:hypothetical protein